MKIKLFISAFILMFFAFAINCNAQAGQHDDKIKTMKVAYLTEQLNLTPAEAEKFWPIYNEYSDEKREIRKSNAGDPSSDSYIELKEKELELEKKYVEQFKAVLPQEKVDKLHKAEKEFKQILIKHAQERRNNSPN